MKILITGATGFVGNRLIETLITYYNKTYIDYKRGWELGGADKQAIEKVANAEQAGKPFDIVFIDLHMPVMGGKEATIELRKMGYQGPIIALTAATMKGVKTELSALGFNDVTEIVFEFTDPDGVFGSVVWNEANNFGGGRFVVSSDTSATIAPVLVTANDSSGDYQWTVTIKTADQSVVQNFVVAYTPVVVPPPPPPEPETPLSLDDFGDSFSTTETPVFCGAGACSRFSAG